MSKSSKKDLTKEVVGHKINVVLIRDRKEVGEKAILTGQVLGDDFTKTGSEKEEVLACQFVTTS